MIPSQWSELRDQLLQAGQDQLVAAADAAGESAQQTLCQTLSKVDGDVPGGLMDYIQRGKKLMGEAAAGKSGWAGWTADKVEGQEVVFGSSDWMSAEEAGIQAMQNACFVLVAGGLGERLGSKRAKVALSVDGVTKKPYMQLFGERIKAFSARAGVDIPWAIMTSSDTHDAVSKLLEDFNYFGLSKSSVTLIKQQKVPCFADVDGTLAMAAETGNSREPLLQYKPHGHGDVHSLLYSSGLVEEWKSKGKQYVMFFQDTNALAMLSAPVIFGTTILRNLSFNSVTVSRTPGEAVGAICQMTNQEDGRKLVLNIEYNELGPVLAAQGAEDAPNASGHSVFPGNINVLVAKIPDYATALDSSRGVVPEFVNPKFAADGRSLKSAARLECMMQSFPLLLSADDHSSGRVSFTTLPRWACFTAMKNDPAAAKAKQQSGLPPESAASAECDGYEAVRRMFEAAGCTVERGDIAPSGNGGTSALLPAVILEPSFALGISDLSERLQGSKLSISKASSLILEGEASFAGDARIEGAVHVNGGQLPSGNISGGKISVRLVDESSTSVEEDVRLHGYELSIEEMKIFQQG